MSLRFDGTDDEVRTAVGAVALTGACTVLTVPKRNTAAWGALIGGHNSSGVAEWQLWCRDDGRVFCDPNWTSSASCALGTGTWGVIGYTRTAGAADPIAHRYNGTNWVHETMTNGSAGDYASISGGTIRFGEWEDQDDLNGWLEVAAVWGSALSNGTIEALIPGDRAEWQAANPLAMWEFDDNPLVDLSSTGTADETTRAGTTADAGDNPSFYTSGAAGVAASFPPVQPYRQTAGAYSR